MAFRKYFWIPGFEAKCLRFHVVFIFVDTCNEYLLPSQKRNLLSFISVSEDFCPRLLLNTMESFQFTTKITVLKCWLKLLSKCILDLYTIGCLEIKCNQRPQNLFSHPLERASSFRDQKFNIIFTEKILFLLKFPRTNMDPVSAKR